MADERRNRLSPTGRLRCSESGRRNIVRAIETMRAAIPAGKAATAAFEQALTEEIGPEPSAEQVALVLSATASFEALYLVRTKLRAARSFKRVEVLVGLLTPLSGSLSRSLRALGMESGAVDEPSEPGAPRSLAEWTENWNARQAPKEAS